MLTGKDLAGTVVATVVVLLYVANGHGWWYLGNNRWAAVTMVAVAAVGCPVGARIAGESMSGPIALLGLLGVAALVLAVIAITSPEQWALLAFAAVVVALWAGTTLRHAVSSPPTAAQM